MKKFVKPLVIAASVAAVAGIGAVSFAKWNQGTTDDKKLENIPIGGIVTMGSITASHDLGEKKLVPYDQADQYDSSKMAQVMNITLGYDGDEGATITMTVTGTAAARLEWDTTGSGNWVAIGSGADVTGKTTVKIRLNSNDDNASDMNTTFTVTFSATAPTVD
ncbi:MAG: hypothetical protein J1G04_05315 [Clostridiales bacterium]|nr:hypothetical protein [Clostridiales bacterium]